MSILAIAAAIAIGAYITLSPKNISASRDPNAPMPEEIVQQNQKADGESEIYLAGGCFWGTDLLMRNISGVTSVEVGYANGTTKNPSYREVCNNSGHAETVHIIYKPQIVSLNHLLDVYYQSIDPTLINRQGNDRGIQYRTGIYYTDSSDAPIVDKSLQELQKKFSKPIVVEHEPIKNFYRAEEEHQDYLIKNPNGYCHVPRYLIDEQIKATNVSIDTPHEQMQMVKASGLICLGDN